METPFTLEAQRRPLPGLNILDGTKEAETVFQKSLIALWVLMDMF